MDQQIRDLQREQASREDHTHGTRSGPIHPGLQRLQNLDAVIMNHDPSPSGTSLSINRASRSRGLRNSDRSSRGRRNRDSMLDSPVPLIDSPSTMPLEPDHDTPTDRLRVKRRKLDSDDNRESVQDLRYGQYGQVVPGTLKMELASCDGGTFEPVCETSGPENILLNDSSVYCTKSDRCNLILKHRGEAPFCLKKLVIKAPKSGYDAPYVQPQVLRIAATSANKSTSHQDTSRHGFRFYVGRRPSRSHCSVSDSVCWLSGSSWSSAQRNAAVSGIHEFLSNSPTDT